MEKRASREKRWPEQELGTASRAAMLVALAVFATVAGMYDEPPGGCNAPQDYPDSNARMPPIEHPANPKSAPSDGELLAEHEMRAYEMEPVGPQHAAQLVFARTHPRDPSTRCSQARATKMTTGRRSRERTCVSSLSVTCSVKLPPCSHPPSSRGSFGAD